MDLRTEGEEGELHEFEALDAACDADDRDAVKDAAEKIDKCHLPAAEHGPDHVGDRMLCYVQIDLFAIGGKGKTRHFKALHTEWDANDGDTQQNANNGPQKKENEAAE